MLRRVKLLMQYTNVLTWEFNRYGRQMTDDRRHTLNLSIVLIQLCGCVSFSVMAGNSSQNENTFLQINLNLTTGKKKVPVVARAITTGKKKFKSSLNLY